MSGKPNLENYVDVDARMDWFYDRFPDGSLQAEIVVGPEQDKGIVVVKAYAYRQPLDDRPGVGLASEPFPGKTSFTNGSELMNAETSAWGRALAAIGAPRKGHIASADEARGAASRRQGSSRSKEKPEQQQPPQAEPQETASAEWSEVMADPHVHDWHQSPTIQSFVVCADPTCRKAQPKDKVPEWKEPVDA